MKREGERGGRDELFGGLFNHPLVHHTHAHEHSDRDDSGSRLMRAPDQANPCQIGCRWIPDKRLGGEFHSSDRSKDTAHTLDR